MAVFISKNQRRDVAFNGPMRSGLVIDSRALLSKGYAAYQQEFAASMEIAHPGDWHVPGGRSRSNRMRIDADTRRGSTIIPGYFIGRTLEGEDLEAELRKHNMPAIVKHSESCQFHIAAIDLRLYDMGYASATFIGEVEALTNLTMEQYRIAVEKASSELAGFRPLYLDMLERVASALKPEFIIANFHGGQKNEYWVNSSLATGVADLFWVHRVFSVACADDKEFAALKAPCKQLIFSEQAELIEDASIVTGMAAYPGNGNSAVVYNAATVKPEQTAALLSMARAQNIFYVAAEDIDRDLFHLSNDLDRQKHSQDMGLLERQSELIVEYQSKVTLFKAVYDDFDNSLDPQGLKIWHALEHSWHTRDRFSNLNTKLELVEKIYNRIRDNLAHLQNKKLGTFMLAFTLISTLSVIVDTVDFTQGQGLQAPSALRIGVLIATLLLIVGFAAKLMKAGARRRV